MEHRAGDIGDPLGRGRLGHREVPATKVPTAGGIVQTEVGQSAHEDGNGSQPAGQRPPAPYQPIAGGDQLGHVELRSGQPVGALGHQFLQLSGHGFTTRRSTSIRVTSGPSWSRSLRSPAETWLLTVPTAQPIASAVCASVRSW